MNQQHWQAAEAIAQSLHQTKTDVSELKKLVSYLRWLQNRDWENKGNHLGDHILEYLNRLVTDGETRSLQTLEYYRTLEKICQENQELFASDIEFAIQTLGWATRLAVYYKHDSPQHNQDQKKSNRQPRTSMAAAFEKGKRP